MKNILRMVAVCLVIFMIPGIAVSAHPFVDVPVGCWYDSAVQFVYDNNFMNGTSDNTFSPQNIMNRGMIITVLYRMNGSPEVENNIPFTDVYSNQYYYNAVCWAYQNGITTGISATEFAPTNSIIRAEMVTMFYRCFGNGYKEKPSDLTQYTDAKTIPNYARNAFAWAINNNIITGTSRTTLHPNTTSDRAQCAAVIQRLANVVKLEKPKEYVFKFEKSPVDMFVGDSLKLNVIYTGDKNLTWTSSDDEIVTVDQNGVVTAHKNSHAYITVSDGDKNATCKVNVNDKRESKITIVEPEIMIMVGDTYQLMVLTEGTVGPLTWMSLDEKVATVNQNGVITALAEGYCYVYVTDGNTEAVCNFRIEKKMAKAEEIRIGYTDGPFYDGVTRYKDDYVVVTAINKPNDAGRDIIATSSNPNVVTVSATKVNGNSRDITLNFKSAGTATITLTSGDGAVSQSYTITVKEDYDFNPGNRQLTPEEFADYTTRVMCANGFIYDPTCTSWRQFTRPANKLNFEQAVADAYSLVHSWWPNDCRYCQIVYIGQNENGDYVFHACW